MNINKVVFTTCFLFFAIFSAIAQTGEIRGSLQDPDGSAIPGANVYLQGTVLGAASSLDGNFRIRRVPAGEFTLTISMIGFSRRDTLVRVREGQRLDLGILILAAVPLQTQPIVVTAGKYEQRIENVPVTINTVSSEDLSFRNSLTVDEALQYVNGVNMNADQVNIRGSSGYSRGVGSRVMMLVDGVPYITGDTQGIVFEAMPVNQVERIEIVKGAGSALYGSSAIGGVINILTRDISDEPQTNVKLVGGLYSEPHYEAWKWSEDSRYITGVRADHSQKNGVTGLRFAASHDRTDGFSKNSWNRRYNVSAKLQFDLTPYDLLTLSGNYMDQKRGNFLYWKDLNNALVPPDDQLDDVVYAKRFYIGTAYRKVFGEDEFLNANFIWFHNYFNDNIGPVGNRSTAEFVHLELRYNRAVSNHFITVGIAPALNDVSSNIFGTRNGFSTGIYVQDEITWSPAWRTFAGARLDFFDIDRLGSDQRISPRLGIVFNPSKMTTVRMSSGTGFRAPSMAEAFTSTVAGGLQVEPNEDLEPERSFSFETGLNQMLSSSLSVDIAFFINYYWDLIEAGFLPSGNIRFDNVTEARIRGLEVSLNWSFLRNRILSNTGYTYIDPRNIGENDFLRYRPRHLLYTGLKAKLFSFWLGADYRYISRYDRIDETFAAIIPDSRERNAAHVVDLRLSTEFSLYGNPMRLTFQVNNLLQYHYVDLIGSIASIRNFILAVESSF